MNEEEKYITLDTEQCKWWVNHLFNIAKEQACNSHNYDDGEEIQSAQDKIIKLLDQQPSDDCISRTQAIEWMENLRQMDECFGNYEDDYFPLSDVIDRLKNVPPVTPTQNEWHLVKDELPNVFSFVNCTLHSLIDDREDWVVETIYVPQYPNSPYSDWGNIPMLNAGDCEVIAWMYRDIPKPYKAEMRGAEDV